MRVRLVLALVPLVLAGCAGAPGAAPPASDAETSMVAAPEPVEIHDVVDLVQGGEKAWTFEVGPGATTVEMRFFATAKAVTGTHLATCLTIETPADQESARVCDSLSTNVVVSPSLVGNERIFYEASGADAPVGTYRFSLDAGPSATDFHAVVTVAYG
jgi:hypothetical protein